MDIIVGMKSSVVIAVLFCLLASVPVVAETAEPGQAPAAAHLINLLKNSASSRVRTQAALALGSQKPDPAVVDALMAALGDSDAKVRGAAGRGLQELTPVEKFDAISERAVKEEDPFALKWIGMAAVRTAAVAPAVYVGIAGLECIDGYERDQATRNLQTGFLVYVLAKNGYNLSSAFDFSTGESGAARAIVNGIELQIKGSLATSGDASSAKATVNVTAVARCGFEVWKGTCSVEDVGPGELVQEDDPFADEYTIRDEPEDARLVAATQAGREAGVKFDAQLRGAGSDTEKH
jgi:hypothetical protein